VCVCVSTYKHIYKYLYICIYIYLDIHLARLDIYLQIGIYICIHTHTSNLSSAQPSLHTWAPAQPSAYTSARIRRAAAHNRPRRIEDRPSAVLRRPRWHAARAESGAYIVQLSDRRSVPRADVRVERRRRAERLRAEAARGRRRRKALARAARITWAPILTRARARTCAHVGASVAHARIRRSDLPCRYAHGYRYMIYCVYQYHVFVCYIDSLTE
jgi:hypothetical protein